MFRKMDSDYEYWVYGRIESDVFCVFFPINQNKYQKHLNDLLNGLQDYRTDFLIEPTIGIFVVTDRKMSIESMFTRASIAAKTIKSGVTDSIIFYDENMEQKMLDEQQVVNDMQTAIEQEQFKVYFQPKYSLRSNEHAGAEALVRWIHPEKGLISPAKFIPVFERNGFIATLDRYMWEHVCCLLKKWQDSGNTILPVSVNVSRISMYSPTTVQFLKDLVIKYDIDPKYLELELTESAYMDDPDEMKKQLKELQNFGFRILMDDFGSGYSSLNTLRELPVDCLKLDIKFLSKSSKDKRGRLVLSSIVRMSKLLDLKIIAEGVETIEQAEFLCDIGCEYVQGYLFSKPMPVSDYENIIKLSVNTEIKEKEKQSDMENIKELLSASDVEMKKFGSIAPVPIAILEYKNFSFKYLRINSLFVSEFGLDKDLRPASKVFKEHLSKKDYSCIIKAFDKCAKTKKTISFKIKWNIEEGGQCDYVGRVSYKGNVRNNGIIMIVAFMDIIE